MKIEETYRVAISLDGKSEHEIRGAICYLQSLLALDAPITIKASEKILAIKTFRSISGRDLKESKSVIEALMVSRDAKKQMEILGLGNFYNLKKEWQLYKS